MRLRPLVLLAAIADALVERFVPIKPIIFDRDSAVEWARMVDDATVWTVASEGVRVVV